MMSALLSLAAAGCPARHHHAQLDDLEAVALQDDADDVLADVVEVALDRRHHHLALALGAPVIAFSASMNGSKCATAFFITRADLTPAAGHLARPEQVAATFIPSISGPSITSKAGANRWRASSVSSTMLLSMPLTSACDSRRRPHTAPLGLDFLLPAHSTKRSASSTSRSVEPRSRRRVGRGSRSRTFAQLGIDQIVDVELAGVDDRHSRPAGIAW